MSVKSTLISFFQKRIQWSEGLKTKKILLNDVKTPLQFMDSTGTKTICTVEPEVGFSSPALSNVEDRFRIVDDPQYLSVAARKSFVDDDSSATLTITAAEASAAGNEIKVALVDPDEASKDLSASYSAETKTLTISHQTGAEKEIESTASAIATYVDEEMDLSATLTVTATEPGLLNVVTEEPVNLEDGKNGMICPAGTRFYDTSDAQGASYYVAIKELDGVDVVATDFLKISTEASGLE